MPHKIWKSTHLVYTTSLLCLILVKPNLSLGTLFVYLWFVILCRCIRLNLCQKNLLRMLKQRLFLQLAVTSTVYKGQLQRSVYCIWFVVYIKCLLLSVCVALLKPSSSVVNVETNNFKLIKHMTFSFGKIQYLLFWSLSLAQFCFHVWNQWLH